jgi:hypothetical protein
VAVCGCKISAESLKQNPCHCAKKSGKHIIKNKFATLTLYPLSCKNEKEEVLNIFYSDGLLAYAWEASPVLAS